MVTDMVIGIDLGGTGIKIGIVNDKYEILAKRSVPTGAERPAEAVIADMAEETLKLLRESGLEAERCAGIGVGCPGTIDRETGVVVYSNNIRWEMVPLADRLAEALHLLVRIANDADCAALGEVRCGAARGCKNAVFLTLGTGVGGGIVIDGELYTGGHPGGVELGHIRAGSEGRLCTCGRRDCLEAYASATALISDARKAAERCPESALLSLCGGDPGRLNAKMVFDAADAGDPCAIALVENYIRYLAGGITDLVNIFRPDIVVLGGGVSAQKEKLTEPVSRYLAAECFGAPRTYLPRVVTAENGNDAGILGAAGLILRDDPPTEPVSSFS